MHIDEKFPLGYIEAERFKIIVRFCRCIFLMFFFRLIALIFTSVYI